MKPITNGDQINAAGDLSNLNEVDAVKNLRKLLDSNSQTVSCEFDDKFCYKFLRSRKYDVDKSYELIVQYVNKVIEKPEIFQWDATIKEAIDTLAYNHYQHVNHTGHHLIIINPGKWTSKVDIMQLIKLSIIGQEINLMDEKTQKNGYMVIINVTGLGLSTVYRCGISNARLISDLTDRCIPIRLDRIHVMFESRLIDIAYSLFKPFLDQELRDKIIFHGHDLKSLHNYCDPANLPASLGGTNEEPDPQAIWKRILEGKDDVELMWNRIREKATTKKIKK